MDQGRIRDRKYTNLGSRSFHDGALRREALILLHRQLFPAVVPNSCRWWAASDSFGHLLISPVFHSAAIVE